MCGNWSRSNGQLTHVSNTSEVLISSCESLHLLGFGVDTVAGLFLAWHENILVDDCTDRAGAAGHFIAPIANLSVGAFKAVVDIDLIGSFITVKATLPHLLASAEKHRTDGKTGKGRLNFSFSPAPSSSLSLQSWVEDCPAQETHHSAAAERLGR